MYSKIKAEAPGPDVLPHISLRLILDGATYAVIQNETNIPGIFTRNGWENYIFDAIYKQAPPSEDWVLAIKAEHRDKAANQKLRREVVRRYLRDYERQWKIFITNRRKN